MSLRDAEMFYGQLRDGEAILLKSFIWNKTVPYFYISGLNDHL